MLIETKDATPLAVDVWGAGRPVVLVHAWGLSSHMWNAQLPALLGAGRQVVTIDHRGHGRSGRPATGYDLDTMAADVLGVLDVLDLDDVVLVGHSMGGTVVAHAAGGLGSPRLAKVVLSAPITPPCSISLAEGSGRETVSNPRPSAPSSRFETIRAQMSRVPQPWGCGRRMARHSLAAGSRGVAR